MNINEDFLNKLIFFADDLAIKIVDIQQEGFNVSFKEDSSPLTKADLLSNNEIKEFITKNSSVKNFISEEDKAIDFKERKDWGYYWVIDPIDGTKEFAKGNNDYCVNIALCKGSEPVFGYVIQPKGKKHFYAIKGEGAFKNGRIISCANLDPNELKIVASKSHINSETEEFIKKIKKGKRNLKTVNIGSALKICLVAEGLADIYPRYGPTMEWDTCAPQIILEEAKGYLLKVEGGSMEYNKENLLNPFFIACSEEARNLF